MPKVKIILIIVLALLAVGGWMWFQQEETGPQEVKIGVIAPLTGSLSVYGINLRNGVMTAIGEFNSSQRELRIIPVIQDNGGDLEKTKEVVQKLVDNPEILGIIGPDISSNTLAAGPIAQAGKVVLITPGATSPQISGLGNYIFRTCPPDTEQGRDVAEFMVKEGYNKIGVIYQEDETYSADLAAVFMNEMKKRGKEVITYSTYKKGDTDFSQQVARMGEKKPEIIFGPGYPTEIVLFLQQLRGAGLTDVQFLGGDGCTTEDYIRFGGTAVEGTITNALFDASNPDPLVQKFVKKYKELYHVESVDWDAATSYDAANILMKAISESKNKDREEVRDLVAKTKDFLGVSGKITFDENGDPLGKKYTKMKVENGAWVFYK